MNTAKTYVLAAAIAVPLLMLGAWLDRNPSRPAPTRRDVAAQQVCEGQPFEWQGSTLICYREAGERVAARGKP